MDTNSLPILVTGGTGKTGRRVAHRLAALGRPVRLGTRRGAPPFDWADSRTWAACLDGVDAVYVAYQPDLGLPGADEVVGAFARQAVASGARRLVLLSGRGEEGARDSERALQDSGAAWTVLRSAFFMQNFSEADWRHEIRAGRLTMVSAQVGEPFVDAEDLAEVAVTALTQDGHVGRTYELTGPRLLTFAEVADLLGRARGRRVEYVGLGVEEYAAHLSASGLPAEEAAGLAHLFGEVLDGRNAHVTTDVAGVLGRPPRDVVDFAAAAAPAWQPAVAVGAE